jgi:hypothetical protein
LIGASWAGVAWNEAASGSFLWESSRVSRADAMVLGGFAGFVSGALLGTLAWALIWASWRLLLWLDDRRMWPSSWPTRVTAVRPAARTGPSRLLAVHAPVTERRASFADERLGWLFALAFVALIFFGVYWFFASFVTSCGGDQMGPIGYVHGGQPESLTAAAVLGALLVIAAAFSVWRVSRSRRRIVLAAIALYAAGLGLLWAVSPPIWGAGVCPGVAVSHVPGQIGALLKGHVDAVESVAFSPDGRLLASSSDDGTIRLWDVRNQRELGQPLWRSNRINTIAFSPNGRELASGACDDTIRLWDVRAHRQLGRPLHAGRELDCVNAVAFSPDGRRLVSASDFGDGRIRLWDVRRHKQVGRPFGHPGSAFNDVAFSPDGRTVAGGVNLFSYGGAVALWDIETHRRLGQPGRVGLQVLTVAFSTDGRLIASGDAEGGVKLWNVRGRRRHGTLYHDPLEMESSVAFSRGGNTIAACSESGTLRVWDVASRRMLLDAHNIEAMSVASSRDGRLLAIGASDGTIRLLRSPR